MDTEAKKPEAKDPLENVKTPIPKGGGSMGSAQDHHLPSINQKQSVRPKRKATEWDKKKAAADKHHKKLTRVIEKEREKRNSDMFMQKDPTAGQLFVFVGKSERGKTHFIRFLLQDQMTRRYLPLQWGLVFVRTKFKHSYDFVPNERVFQGYNEDVLKKYVANLEGMYRERGHLPPSFLVFDDLVGILTNQTNWFTNFISTYRHYNITIIVAVQYLTGRNAISPIMREQTTYALMFRSGTAKTIQNLYESYGQMFPTKNDFQDYLMRNTEPTVVGPYVCIVYIDNEDDITKNYIPVRAPAKLFQLEQNPESDSKKYAGAATVGLDRIAREDQVIERDRAVAKRYKGTRFAVGKTTAEAVSALGGLAAGKSEEKDAAFEKKINALVKKHGWTRTYAESQALLERENHRVRGERFLNFTEGMF